jgi:7-cyano-7-deazaguanine synthase
MSVLLLSGGLDSAVCLAMERPDVALFVDYGQPHREQEEISVNLLAARYDVPLEVARIRVPYWQFRPDDSTMLVPGRNLVLVSLASAIASPVIIGCNADDFEVYPDCRPEFFAALALVAEVQTPLIAKRKTEIGVMAYELEVDVGETWSCYYPSGSDPCGECDACRGRAVALEPTECGTLSVACRNDNCSGHCEVP